ncbi:hypothetical protein FGG08_005389 [Glutinoglossum americanum]|uniref:Uncharacterized protein n=1 Tax=Glutinoglossum americanum TaxID=1670608 RepID=A0A9P8I7B8_9PEZI|nr:hypothetical protein FGG08_005389 [Glutinoglossum americanum]
MQEREKKQMMGMMLSLFRHKSFVLPSLILNLFLNLTVLTTTTYALPRSLTPFQKRNLATLSSIYDLTVFPNQLPILIHGPNAVPAGLFNNDASGRVNPVGNFSGFEDSIEYFFALSPIAQQGVRSVVISKAEIVEFTSSCPEVAASVVYLETKVVNPGGQDDGKQLSTLKQVAFWRFDDCGAVLKYDAWIPNLNTWLEVNNGFSISDPSQQARSIEGLCAVTQQKCMGADSQWTDIDHCVTSLSQKPYGTYDEAWGDNIVCRTIHLVLTTVRPDVHCPHVGPSGGGKCVDYPYQLEYFTDQAVFGDPQGQTFQCT